MTPTNYFLKLSTHRNFRNTQLFFPRITEARHEHWKHTKPLLSYQLSLQEIDLISRVLSLDLTPWTPTQYLIHKLIFKNTVSLSKLIQTRLLEMMPYALLISFRALTNYGREPGIIWCHRSLINFTFVWPTQSLYISPPPSNHWSLDILYSMYPQNL